MNGFFTFCDSKLNSYSNSEALGNYNILEWKMGLAKKRKKQAVPCVKSNNLNVFIFALILSSRVNF